MILYRKNTVETGIQVLSLSRSVFFCLDHSVQMNEGILESKIAKTTGPGCSKHR